MSVAADDPIEIVSLQSKKMGRPSLIYILLSLQAGKATRIEVGDGAVPVFEGVVTLSD